MTFFHFDLRLVKLGGDNFSKLAVIHSVFTQYSKVVRTGFVFYIRKAMRISVSRLLHAELARFIVHLSDESIIRLTFHKMQLI